MRARRVFCVGKDAKIAPTAEKLAHHFYPDTQIQSVNFAYDKCMSDLQPAELESVVMLGYSNGVTYGDYTPEQFATHLSNQFKGDEKLKDSVQHLYLVGCDMGLIQEDGLSYAQDVANRLKKKGFCNIRIHSVARPQGSVGESLFIEVITRVGALGGLTGAREGYLSAFILTQQDGEQYFKLLQENSSYSVAADKFKKQHAFVFLTEENPVNELNKPHNTFVPDENPEVRKYRIANHSYAILSKEQAIAIECLSNRLDYERAKKSKKMAQKLDFIIGQLENSQPEKWKELVVNYINFLTINALGIQIHNKSNSLKLLIYLGQGNFEKAQKIIQDQKLKSDKKTKKETLSSVAKHASPVVIATEPMKSAEVVDISASHSGRKKDLTTTELDKSTKKLDLVKEYPETQDQFLANNQDNQTLKDSLILIAAKSRIDGMVGVLNIEINSLLEGCFPFLNRFEITTKIQKRDALLELKSAKTLSALQTQASHLTLNNRVMRSAKTSRTSEFLRLILENPNELYVAMRKEAHSC